MRTQKEIAQKLRESDSFFGFDREVYASYLSLHDVKGFVKEGTTEKDWGEPQPLTREAVIAEMRNYMAFAWGKVRDHRGISASRSVEKFGAWLWVLGDDELLAKIEDVDYAQYGAPALKLVCEAYGFEVPEGDDIARMCRGEPCEPGCDSGCGA